MERRIEPVTFLDTHIVVWLYAGLTSKFTVKAVNEIENNDIFISQFVNLELQYLYEIGRINTRPGKIVHSLSREIGLNISNTSLKDIIKEALNISWTRDVFDRIYVAEAKTGDATLVTADNKIRENFGNAVW